jgi:hypothetical protein
VIKAQTNGMIDISTNALIKSSQAVGGVNGIDGELATMRSDALNRAKAIGLFRKFLDERVEQESGRTALMVAAGDG